MNGSIIYNIGFEEIESKFKIYHKIYVHNVYRNHFLQMES
ncbi:hypothetical protein LBBP_01835 [Leptospira borgpetersenii serovar Ballum]|uniref:Uncharacterized protein n=1 Tax=Leptospira borgpetersenii serovar Ballum TaxID=280505 RepID=A0A0S2IR27_LEPBO|nr:hypothetical protein LBBP_01835 [Leptospira borgpetersenii serovar Ballum]